MAIGPFLKKYWWIVLIVVIVMVLPGMMLTLMMGSMSSSTEMIGDQARAGNYVESGYAKSYGYQEAMDDFAPEVKEREKIKTSTMSTEVKRGTFDDANERVHTIVSSSEGIFLNENTYENIYGHQGNYKIKIPTDQFDNAIDQLRQIGEVTAYQENQQDVTGRVVDNSIELTTERSRLDRLKRLYDSRASLDDKLRLEQAIFDQEKTIAYLEASMEGLDQNILYSSLTLSVSEERSAWSNFKFVEFSDLVKTFVESVKALLYFLFAVIPWIVLIGIFWWLIAYIIRRKNRKQAKEDT